MNLSVLGLGFQITALITSLLAVLIYAVAYYKNANRVRIIGNYLFLGTTFAIVMASAVLVTALVLSDFSLKYVVVYSDSSLPLFYKITAFWGGQAGSLLLWTLLLVIFGTIEIFRLKSLDSKYQSAVMLSIAFTTGFFVLLVSFLQNPFDPSPIIPLDGQGLNPLLQNPGMVIHPPTLYIGYVGYSVIIAHAVAAIMTKDFSSYWIKQVRPWSLVVWAFLTIGIVIGGWWAYVELGWGGYWAWDPVENASLMPWFTATAFIHSAYIYEKKGSLRIWTFILLLITFELTILGTYITRSGVIQSVHSFGPNAIGTYFLVFIGVTTVLFLVSLFFNPKFKEIIKDQDFKTNSREGIVLVSNWVFLAITIAIIFGTLSPTVTDWSFTVPYFNKVTRPFFFLLFLLTGFGLLTGFSILDYKKHYTRLLIAGIIAFVGVLIMLIFGYNNSWSLAIGFSIYFSFAAVMIRLFDTWTKGKFNSIKKAKRFYSAMAVHLGVVILAFGINMSAFYGVQEEYIVNTDTTIEFKDYKFIVGEHATVQEQNYISDYVPIKIYEDDKLLTTAYPELRQYSSHANQSFGEIAYLSQFTGDLYFALLATNSDGSMRILFIHQPFVSFIWFGSVVMMLAALITAFRIKKKTQTENGSYFSKDQFKEAEKENK